MTPDAAKRSLARALATGDNLILQRGMGPGAVRAANPVRGRFVDFQSTNLAGTIKESDRRMILSADDVAAAGLNPVLANNDRLDLNGRLYVVQSIDDTTRRIGGVLIAYEVRVSGT